MTSQISSKNGENNPDAPLAKFYIPIFSYPMVVPFQKYALDIWSFRAIKSASALGLYGPYIISTVYTTDMDSSST